MYGFISFIPLKEASSIVFGVYGAVRDNRIPFHPQSRYGKRTHSWNLSRENSFFPIIHDEFRVL